jgi:hypothetical protein
MRIVRVSGTGRLAVAAVALAWMAACGGGSGGTDVLAFQDAGTRTDVADVAEVAAGDTGTDGGRDLAPEPGNDATVADTASDTGTVEVAAEVAAPDAAPDGVAVDVAADLAATDPGASDPGEEPGADPGPADTGATDPGGETIGPAPWVQCTDDAPCKALFGEYATCNRLFPGGQCMGCDPEAPGVHIKCTQLSQQMDITLSCRMANGGVCLYDCPCPSWLRCLDSEQLCVLKSCTADGECGPFQCLEIGEPGSNRYCLPPR